MNYEIDDVPKEYQCQMRYLEGKFWWLESLKPHLFTYNSRIYPRKQVHIRYKITAEKYEMYD